MTFRIPRIQVLALALFAAVQVALFVFVYRPLLLSTWEPMMSLVAGQRADTSLSLEQLKQECARLAALDSSLAVFAATPGSASAWYDFLQNTLTEAGMSAGSIAGAPVGSSPNGAESFEIRFTSDYHSLGRFVAAIENGPYAAGVSTLHASAEKLTAAAVDVTLLVTFGRGEQ